jgi:FAD:protein FMN transferase
MAKELFNYRHEAMNTWFEIAICGVEKGYSRKAATEVFREIDRLENLLSRFREGSDVDILNKRASAEPVRVTEECWDCILQAMDVEILTNGLFSIAFESYMELPEMAQNPEVGSWLEMDPDALTVYFKYPGLRIDLGGIGKGFALDRIVDLLDDWEVPNFLLHSGTSSVLARGDREPGKGWPVSVGADDFTTEVYLRNEAISGSSLAVQGTHILNLKMRQPLQTGRRTWAWASSCVLSDALSTSFMLMPIKQIEELCQNHSDLGALVLDAGIAKPQLFGRAAIISY